MNECWKFFRYAEINDTDKIINIFNQLHDKGNTIILVTHEEEVAKNAKRMILILDGKVKSDIKN